METDVRQKNGLAADCCPVRPSPCIFGSKKVCDAAPMDMETNIIVKQAEMLEMKRVSGGGNNVDYAGKICRSIT